MSPRESEKKLTDKQDLILNFIRDKIRDSGFPPTVREIGDHFEITVKGAYDHLKAIEKKGYIRTEQNKSRAIVIIEDEDHEIPANALNVPLLGRIAAGAPLLAEENIEEYLSFPADMFSNGEYFALHVHGDSMTGGGILNGDIAIIRKQSSAVNGEVVAALIDDEATLKTFKMDGGRVQLVAQNPAYKPIVPENLTILGKLAAVFRRY